MPIFKGLKSKLGAGEPKKETKAKPLPPRLAFTEQTYPDEYIIKNFDDLFSKTVRVWRGGDWNKNVRNGATGALFESSHHVPGEGAKDRAAFKDGKFGFCLEWINFLYEGKVYRVRCMNAFCVRSQQCTDHPKAVYKDGPNRIYDLLNWGETIRYGMIKDIGAPEVPLTDEQRRLQAVKDLKELENRLGVAYDDGQPAEELTNQVEIMRRAISNKSYLLEDRSNAAPQPSAPATILNSRKALSNNAPGNPDLDAKAKRNPNNAAKGGKTAFTRALDSINEHPGS
ncbi:hypothetical protein J4E90_004463 [Alternaria incomplexa]|uniref:uncharacterized protein n=1 Tax=Alternaria incomplexa TaxID=1187928 RepID=UPI00222128E7|nr:uncharacterized protein J4E90_004463 [Alternaria incomplexa]KAI4916017.1 hypothetical protein J4E90_004463 [Alternaria incomplexa]